jgi:hypothetical protein
VDATLGELVEQPRGHLASSRVLDADEQDLRDFLGQLAFHLPQCSQALAREAMHEERDEVPEAGTGQVLERLGHVALDRFGGEDPGELVRQRPEPLLEVGPGDRVDVEVSQLGGHSDYLLLPLEVSDRDPIH